MGSEIGAWDNIDGIHILAFMGVLWTLIGSIFVVPRMVRSVIGRKSWPVTLAVNAILWIPAWMMHYWDYVVWLLVGVSVIVIAILYLANRQRAQIAVTGAVLMVMLTTGGVLHLLRLDDAAPAIAQDAGCQRDLRQCFYVPLSCYSDEHGLKMPAQEQFTKLATEAFIGHDNPEEWEVRDAKERVARYHYTGASMESYPPKPLVYRCLSETSREVVPKRTIVLYTDGKIATVNGYQHY